MKAKIIRLSTGVRVMQIQHKNKIKIGIIEPKKKYKNETPTRP